MVQSVVKSPKGPTRGKPGRNGVIPGTLNPRQAEFARQIVLGKTQAEAYTIAYLPPEGSKKETLESLGHRVYRRSAVAKEVARLRAQLDRRVLVSLNDRLKILAGEFLDPEADPDIKIRGIVAYSRISGDQAPDRQEVTGKDGAPLEVNVSTGPLVRRLSARERLAEMKRVREERERPIELLPAPPEPLENAS